MPSTGTEARYVLDLTLAVDHAVVDGAPTTRFGNRLLRNLIEPAAVLSSPS
jgi:pyruvate/2-oxoglutarate dehydrogenase complex dihydrolipoamide acyltransferase (E2) component